MAFENSDNLQRILAGIAEEDQIAAEGKAADIRPQFRAGDAERAG
jgi:hypothetical protein